MDEFANSASLAAVIFFEWLPVGLFIVAAWFLLDRIGAAVTRTMNNRYASRRGDE